jgi:hypothetical protein
LTHNTQSFFSLLVVFLLFIWTKSLLFSSNIFAIIVCFTSTFFLEKSFHLFYNKKSILSLLEFSNLFLLQVIDNKGYNAWFVYSQGQFLHYHCHNNNSNTKIIFHVVANFFFVHAIFKDLSSFVLLFHLLDSCLFMFAHSHFQDP